MTREQRAMLVTVGIGAMLVVAVRAGWFVLDRARSYFSPPRVMRMLELRLGRSDCDVDWVVQFEKNWQTPAAVTESSFGWDELLIRSVRSNAPETRVALPQTAEALWATIAEAVETASVGVSGSTPQGDVRRVEQLLVTIARDQAELLPKKDLSSPAVWGLAGPVEGTGWTPLTDLDVAMAPDTFALAEWRSETTLAQDDWYFHAYSGIVVIAFLAFFVLSVRYAWPRTETAKNVPSCPECGYDLTGNLSGTCPECGASVSEKLVQCGDGAGRASAGGREDA